MSSAMSCNTKTNGFFSDKCKEMNATVQQIPIKPQPDGSSNDSDDSDNINMEKLKFIKTKAAQQ